MATAGAAAPLVAAVGATVTNTAVAAAATAVATTALKVAVLAEAAAIAAKARENKQNQTYSVYFLEDDNHAIQYVGRVTDSGYSSRMKHHEATKHLTPAKRISGLTYEQARGLEEIGMIECHTLKPKENFINNRIHGISSSNPKYGEYMRAGRNCISELFRNMIEESF